MYLILKNSRLHLAVWPPDHPDPSRSRGGLAVHGGEDARIPVRHIQRAAGGNKSIFGKRGEAKKKITN